MAALSPQRLEQVLRGTPLAGTGKAFIDAGRRYRVDPRLMVSIASAESSLGQHAQGHNPFGWGPGIQFGSWNEAIHTVTRGLREGYLNQGLRTVEQIQKKWAPLHVANDPSGLNSNWVKNVRAMMRQLGGGGLAAGAAAAGGAAGARYAGDTRKTFQAKVTTPGELDLGPFFQQQMMESISGGRPQRPTDMLANLVEYVRTTPPSPAKTTKISRAATRTDALPAWAQNGGAAGGGGKLGRVILPKSADRPGVRTQSDVLGFARRVAGVFGAPLRVGTGTNHSRLTVDGNVSQHWSGHAVDIPASGATLTRMGQAALIAAGMPAAQARKQRGGLYNIGGHQVIFNTTKGGNHWNHLHLGF